MQDMTPYTVLLAQNRESPDSSIKRLLEQRNIEVSECTDGIEAIRKSFAKTPDLIILDVTLPRLNGYLCARILKNDPFMSSTPIIHIGSVNSPIEQYWTTVCGGDDYLQKPVNETALDESLHRFLRKGGSKRRLLGPVSMLQDMEDFSILTLATNIMEQELLHANILNEINMIDIMAMPTKELVMAVMSVVGSLYDFDLGVALLLFDHQGEFFFYQTGDVDQNHLDGVKELVFIHLQQRHEIYVNPGEIKQDLLQSNQIKDVSGEPEDVYIHTKEGGPIRSVLAFENIGFEELRKDEQVILRLALDLAQGVLEKKIFFQMSQELSIIDAVTEGFSMPFFMTILGREIENAVRNGYSLILTTVAISNLEEITKNLTPQEAHGLIGIIQGLILKAMRKSDIVARWEMASFAFLLTHTPLEKARIAQERISNYIKNGLSRHLPSSADLVLDTGICQFNPERDKTPEIFFSHAKPKGAFEPVRPEEVQTDNDREITSS